MTQESEIQGDYFKIRSEFDKFKEHLTVVS